MDQSQDAQEASSSEGNIAPGEIQLERPATANSSIPNGDLDAPLPQQSEVPTPRPSSTLPAAANRPPLPNGTRSTGADDERAGKATGTHKVRPNLNKEQVVKGSHPGDTFIQYTRKAGAFQRKGFRSNIYAASLETEAPRTGMSRVFNRFKRVVIGRPISSEQSIHERLTNVKALAVLSSDALSSVAYATEEILRVLILAAGAAGSAALSLTIPIGFAVMALLAIVATSYRQTIAAYPRGGGSYIVAKDNLGTMPGLIAAASILIDYTMTVAVSVSAGIAAIYSLAPAIQPYRVELCVAIVALVTIANLRGVREAGNIFTVPTYLFVAGVLAMIGIGLARLVFGIGGVPQYIPPPETLKLGTDGIGIFLILRAFTQGCTALTGVEAISDGVPAFKPPESNNARKTLLWMAVLAITMFGGITYLSSQLGIRPSDQETVISQLARNVFPSFGTGTTFADNPFWYFLNIATALILVLAANTAFSDFPRLSYFLARDKFMPRQYAFRGDRLAFSWGIVTLAILACVLIIAFGGDTTALIPLYTVGVFASFTLSQSGMVVRWWRMRTPGWQRSMIVNGLGALSTLIVLVVSAVTKFQYGAWIVMVLVPVIIALFLTIERHYKHVEREVAAAVPNDPLNYKHTFIVPVASLNAVALNALSYAASLSSNVTAVHISEGEDMEEAERFNREWKEHFPNTDINLTIIESPYRSLIGPLLSYIDALDQQSPDDIITIVLPETLPSKPWQFLLHNQSALRLKASLLFRPNTVVADVPYLLGRGKGASIGAARSLLGGIPWGFILTLLVIAYFVYQLFFKK